MKKQYKRVEAIRFTEVVIVVRIPEGKRVVVIGLENPVLRRIYSQDPVFFGGPESITRKQDIPSSVTRILLARPPKVVPGHRSRIYSCARAASATTPAPIDVSDETDESLPSALRQIFPDRNILSSEERLAVISHLQFSSLEVNGFKQRGVVFYTPDAISAVTDVAKTVVVVAVASTHFDYYRAMFKSTEIPVRSISSLVDARETIERELAKIAKGAAGEALDDTATGSASTGSAQGGEGSDKASGSNGTDKRFDRNHTIADWFETLSPDQMPGPDVSAEQAGRELEALARSQGYNTTASSMAQAVGKLRRGARSQASGNGLAGSSRVAVPTPWAGPRTGAVASDTAVSEVATIEAAIEQIVGMAQTHATLVSDRATLIAENAALRGKNDELTEEVTRLRTRLGKVAKLREQLDDIEAP